MAESIGFIGLGAMGAGMAESLLNAGFRVRVYNRTEAKAKPLLAKGAILTHSPAEAAQDAEIVVTMLTDDRALEEVTLGEKGFAPQMSRGGIHLSCSTISPNLAKRLADAHRERGGKYVAAPVFGRPDVAAAAKLWIAVSGPVEAKERVLPLLHAMGQAVSDFGEDVQSAHVVKLACNAMLMAAVEAMAEAFTLTQKYGVDRTAFYDLFSNAMFACPVYKTYGRMLAEEKYLTRQESGQIFTANLMRKDATLILQAAHDALTPLPLAGLVYDRLTAMVAKGRGDMDGPGFALEVKADAGL